MHGSGYVTVVAAAAGQILRVYPGVGVFNWCYHALVSLPFCGSRGLNDGGWCCPEGLREMPYLQRLLCCGHCTASFLVVLSAPSPAQLAYNTQTVQWGLVILK